VTRFGREGVGAEERPPHDWDRLARWYPRQVRWERVALAVAVDLADPTEGETLVDLGTGTGALLAEVLRRPRQPREAIGIDSAAPMLAQAPPLPEGWRVALASVEDLPLESASADIVTAAYLLHVLGDAKRSRALQEARRVLRPGGRIVCVTPFVARHGTGRVGAAALDLVASLAPDSLGGLRTLDTRPLLDVAGFTPIRARTTRRGYPSLCVLARL